MTDIRKALIERLQNMRGPFLGDGVNPGVTTHELIAALQPAEAASPPVAGGEDYDEIKATLQGAHQLMEHVSSVERRIGPLGSHARGYTHKITKALRHLDALATAARATRPAEAAGEVRMWAIEQIARACAEADISDSKFESLAISLHYMPATQQERGPV